MILFCCTLFSILIATSTALDNITANQTIRDDDNSTIESAGGMFELGFFSPGSSKNRYLGIWYKKISNKTVVWVANRETPLSDNSGVLTVDANGSLVLIDGTNGIIWSSNSFQSKMSLVAQLLDTGNFVIRHENDFDPENFLWQSFDHPGDTILPDMKLGWDLKTGLNRYTTSWKSANDPSPSIYTSKVDRNGYPQLLVWEGTVVKFRFGPWDGIQFSGLSLSVVDITFDVKAVFNQKEIYFAFEVTGSNVMRLVLSPYGEVLFLRWADGTQSWERYLSALSDECDRYALCGAYGSCNITQSQSRYGVCGCLGGYQPKYPKKWESGNWSDGCVRKTEFNCGSGDAFVKYSALKLPDTRHSWTDPNVKLEECANMCLKNCSCTAYSHLDIREDGIGCMMWFDDLLDIRNYRASGLDLYVKINPSELEAKRSSKRRRKLRFIVLAVLVVPMLLLGLFMIRIFRKRMLRKKGILELNRESDLAKANEREDLDLPVFDFILIAKATNNFSQNNKLGEGGFGPVYKGILDDGQEIAVKRLSKDSRQGLDEFKNEVSYIAKLRHRNLVRLLGCCIEEGEMLLIYEYMPNKSLDSFIFDKELSKSLDWPQRYNIINGIARGLLYLHQDSIVRIIHRDLKASNILLDYDMNPKISDFGMARSFGGSERIANTTKVVGTFGYMSPEYALDGIFSVKSDVYSFGVLLLEIVSGKKMTGFYDPDPGHNLLDHAWRLYKAGKFLELIAGPIVESHNQLEVFRAIQIGLLCVQPYPEDRPSMSFVVLMLSSEIELPQPKQPGFFTERIQVESCSHKLSHFSSSSESNTLVSPR